MNLTWILVFSLFVISQLASAKILLIGKNTFLSFDDVEANFTPMVTSSGECGVLYAAEPLDACSDLTNKVENKSKFKSSYVLIIRGGCSFEDKVRRAQKAGFEAAIVYNDDYDEFLVPMAGNSSGVHIHGVLVTKASGEVLKEYVGRTDMDMWLIPSLVTSALSIMAISCISLLAMSAVLATCFFVRRRQVRRQRVRPSRPQLFSRMSRNLLQNMPTLVFRGVLEEGSTSVTCAICIDDYHNGDKLRILPCQHRFHALCIDSWLGHWRSFCPVCKRDARTSKRDLPASERTPLLFHSLTTTSTSSFLSSSSRIPLQSSYDLPIGTRKHPNSSSSALQPHTVPMSLPRSRSHTSLQYLLDQSRRSYCHSSPIPISRSSLELTLPRSLGQPTTSTLHERYTYKPSPGSSSILTKLGW